MFLLILKKTIVVLANHFYNMFLQQEEKHPQAITSVVYCEITSIYSESEVWKIYSKFLSQDITRWSKFTWIKKLEVATLLLN